MEDYVPPKPAGTVIQTGQTTHIQLEPDTGYLANPGMGWQDGPEPFGFMNVPETISYSNRRDIGWSVLNPKRGTFEWGALNRQLAQAVQHGNQFSFRVYTYVGEGFDGSMIPDWVMDDGMVLLPSGKPDYSSCIYQEKWGDFVEALIKKFDGNPDIAFIDISGYGDFNEWSWQDDQTEWDSRWEDDYLLNIASPESLETLDGQARRRLADMFIGGTFTGHSCRMPDGEVARVDYAYRGFQKTQLVMPYAGIVQSTQYVFSRRKNVGFRYDCLGWNGDKVLEKVGDEIAQIWREAPVVFELCRPDDVNLDDARMLLQKSHGSVIHNNNWKYSSQQLEELISNMGYRYFLKEAELELDGRQLMLDMQWENTGSAPNYPKMGQDFSLYLYLINPKGKRVFAQPIPAGISGWLPALSFQGEAPLHSVSETISLPSSIGKGLYFVGISIVDKRTGLPIKLGFGGIDSQGINILCSITIK